MTLTAKQQLIYVLLGTGAFGTNEATVTAVVDSLQNFIDSQINQLAITPPATTPAPKPSDAPT